jgi:hypothetical protein
LQISYSNKYIPKPWLCATVSGPIEISKSWHVREVILLGLLGSITRDKPSIGAAILTRWACVITLTAGSRF